MRKKALIITWNGFQDQEVIYPYYRLLEEGFEVDIAAEKAEPIAGIFGITFNATVSIVQLQRYRSVYDYDLLVLPGGVKALEKLRQQTSVLEFIKVWNEAGNLIASTCHGAQLLISAGAVRGRVVGGYYSIKDDINNAGGIYSSAACTKDGNIISSPHYKFMGEWMKGVIDEFNTRHS